MQRLIDSENQCLYYNSEKTNPFTKDEDLNLNRHMWWHYEEHYSHCKIHQRQFPKLLDYIKDILNNKVDYGDMDGKLLRMYQNSSTKSVED
ncbi:hypothetical protein [Kaistella polysaccharea]|uniref:hypothetical protein n=1 Tax=Kaistella polysaccharea TaxID=2878534 RepID=UPI001CF35759|nr:hypothetical protein [Kaistella polysaccharea]